MTEHQPFQVLQSLMEESHMFHEREHGAIRGALLEDGVRPADGGIPLPDVTETGRPLQEVLRERTAIRFFDPSPIELDDLATVLAAAIAGDQADWQEQRERGLHVNVKVIAWRVNGLECPHVYKYDVGAHSLIPVGAVPAGEEAEMLVLQREFSWAPALIVVTGSLGAALDYYGSHGYRHMLVRGGSAGYRAWLAALSLGYTGSVFAGLLPRPLTEYAKVDGYKESQLFAFCFGRPYPIPFG